MVLQDEAIVVQRTAATRSQMGSRMQRVHARVLQCLSVYSLLPLAALATRDKGKSCGDCGCRDLVLTSRVHVDNMAVTDLGQMANVREPYESGERLMVSMNESENRQCTDVRRRYLET